MHIVLQSFALEQTRAEHADTDYLAAALWHAPFRTPPALSAPQIRRWNSVNNGVETSGTYKVGMSFEISNTFTDRDALVFSYLLINHGGGKEDQVESACRSALEDTALTTFQDPDSMLVSTPGGGQVPQCMLPALRAADDINRLWNVVKPQFAHVHANRCDGPVAIDRFSFRGDFLAIGQLHGTFSFIYEGTDSRDGCGPNSHYSVQWAITD
jgi:hypothetical protein